ncbi:hypothetical protein QL285_028750 [Trifolium repens]|nr:hypothetical protein QL285_028750 [Trifolium repens]
MEEEEKVLGLCDVEQGQRFVLSNFPKCDPNLKEEMGRGQVVLVIVVNDNYSLYHSRVHQVPGIGRVYKVSSAVTFQPSSLFLQCTSIRQTVSLCMLVRRERPRGLEEERERRS